MDVKPIKTEADYEAALEEIETLFDAEPDTSEGDRLEVLITLVEAYEEKHHKIPLPDPIEAIEYHMERLGLSRRDLEPHVGSRARVSEILNRKRPLTLRMIRNLETALGIPASILVQEYELDRAAVEYEVVEPVSLFRSQNAGGPTEDREAEEQVLAGDKIFVDEDGTLNESAAILISNWPTKRQFDYNATSAG